MFLIAFILGNLSKRRVGAAWRRVAPGFSTQLSTDFVGCIIRAVRRSGGKSGCRLSHIQRLLYLRGE